MTYTIQEVINRIVQEIPGAPLADTVDTLKTGDPNWEVRGIVTTFMATVDVIRQAIQTGANFIITHEPTYYNGRDKIDWLKEDSVYQQKLQLLEENHIAVWRFHDYWHMHRPDGILTGVLKKLEWESYLDQVNNMVVLPSMTLGELTAHLKEKLQIPAVRVIGNPDMKCEKIGMLLGAIGGENQIRYMMERKVDVLVCGETNEWETYEYIRDAAALGENRALILLGHANSEEAGMEYLVDWLKDKVSGVPIAFIPAGDPARYL